VWRKPEFTLPVTVPAGAVAMEAPASPVGGAAAETEPAKLRGRSAAARATEPQKASRRAPGLNPRHEPLIPTLRSRMEPPFGWPACLQPTL
jgi:hypothetical protein